ncbi:MAG: chorismate mutase [Spirochaetota bacterium]|nr:chorismate mutase [Spirochaetota bacterium]
MALRGVRGAITVDSNTKEEIVNRTKELLNMLAKKNDIHLDDIASIIFSVTEDLNAEFPAVAARKIGWVFTPLFCTREINVPGSLQGCIRVLMHINSNIEQKDIVNVFLRDAKKLRPDLETKEKDKHYISDES